METRSGKEERDNEIVRLYVEARLSMAQIALKVGLSPSAITYILDTRGIKRRSISDAIITLGILSHNKKPFLLKKNLSRKEEDLKAAGVMLYWGEGGKTQSTVNFANSDPEMIKVFLVFLRNVCGISEERLRALIHRYPDQDPRFLQEFWSSVTGIPKERFYREFVHKGKLRTYKTKSRYGTLAVTYADVTLLRQILGWVDEYRQKLL